MNSREMTIMGVALGVWGAWRLVGSSLLPVGSQEVGIAIIVLFKPWLDTGGWMSLLTINATSYLHRWYTAWLWLSGIFDVLWTPLSQGLGLIGNNYEWPLGISWLVAFTYFFYIWPYIWEKVYLKAGVWGKLKWVK